MTPAVRRHVRANAPTTPRDTPGSRGPSRRAGPSLPCLTIARSPANDVRVILDALSAMPALRLLAGGGDAWLGEHRGELRALLQHVTTRLSGTIEGAAPHADVAPPAPQAGVAPPPPPTTRPAARHRHAADSTSDRPAAPPPGAEWDGGFMLR